MSDTQHKSSNSYQKKTVLVMQGGGSLGAYECGVCKVLAKHDIKFDIIAGTSIGAINASIIASRYAKRDGIKNSVKCCEDFWMDLAAAGNIPSSSPFAFLPYKEKSELSAAYSLLYGNQRAFTPLWITPGGIPYYYFFNSPYLYNVGKFKKTISEYVDFTKLGPHSQNPQGNKQLGIVSNGGEKNSKIDNNKSTDIATSSNVNSSVNYNETKNSDNSNNGSDNNKNQDVDNSSNEVPRLILTATNVQTGEPVIFDSAKINITVDHVMASAGYAVYGLPWTKINDSYLWDGAFVHNTPLRAATRAIDAQKIVYVTDVFPRKQKNLPRSMPETYHRIRDLLFTDRSIEEMVEISKTAKKDLLLIEQMHDFMVSEISTNTKSKSKFNKIEEEYNNLVHDKQGLIMDKIVHLQRNERPGHHFVYEDADFSIDTIKELIIQGQEDAEDAIEQADSMYVYE
jgi:NTE family protein